MWYTRFKKIILSCVFIAVLASALTGCTSDKVSDTPSTEETVEKPLPVITVENDIGSETVEGKTEEEEGEEEVAEPDPDDYFTAEEIPDDVFAKMQGKSFPEGCTTPREQLRFLRLLYKDIDGCTHEGEMVCSVTIADKLTDIFRKLYDADYPIEKMVLIDEYGGDDDASMSDNNTSCFNYRVVSGTTNLSKHAMGLAVDLNPRYNPYIHTVDGRESVEPANGEEYADRSRDFSYKIDKEDLAYKLFIEAGFTWGGSWKNSKDYQHFQYM